MSDEGDTVEQFMELWRNEGTEGRRWLRSVWRMQYPLAEPEGPDD